MADYRFVRSITMAVPPYLAYDLCAGYMITVGFTISQASKPSWFLAKRGTILDPLLSTKKVRFSKVLRMNFSPEGSGTLVNIDWDPTDQGTPSEAEMRSFDDLLIGLRSHVVAKVQSPSVAFRQGTPPASPITACPKCGRPRAVDELFCGQCGSKF